MLGQALDASSHPDEATPYYERALRLAKNSRSSILDCYSVGAGTAAPFAMEMTRESKACGHNVRRFRFVDLSPNGPLLLPHNPRLSLTAIAKSCSEPRYRSVV